MNNFSLGGAHSHDLSHIQDETRVVYELLLVLSLEFDVRSKRAGSHVRSSITLWCPGVLFAIKWILKRPLQPPNQAFIKGFQDVVGCIVLKPDPVIDPIPYKGVSRINAHKIPLPCPLTNPLTEAPELCLIIDDKPKSGLNKDAAKKKIQNDNIPISKIIKISKLKTDYRPFKAKRKLCDSYDMFFADKRVVPLLPKMLLGKQFFKKKKISMTLDLKHQNWKEQIDKACGSTLLFLRTGTCSVVKVGRVSMSREEISKNVMAAINGIAEIVPRKWGGIRSFHLKLLDSLALPLMPEMRKWPKIKKIESERRRFKPSHIQTSAAPQLSFYRRD
ncbi:hypothetical protein NC651_028143 [Populus alba x Populus x berolinensis]|nr:hypothetical protein NC651_028143 [Populus alba x Populus x berolinensis]